MMVGIIGADAKAAGEGSRMERGADMEERIRTA